MRRIQMKAPYFLATLAFLGAVWAKFGVDYCQMKCPVENNEPMEHLLCKFKHESSKGECTNIRGRMTPEERMHILAFHNLHRNEMGMDPVWVKYPSQPDNLKYARREPDCWLAGFTGALCIRQMSWSYENEKAAQIWAEQCAGDKETYNCITDFKENFPQYMSVYTMDGVVDGEKAMSDAFEYWRATNYTMRGLDHPPPPPGNYTETVYDENNLGDFTFNDGTEFLPWASMTYWRTFLLGCGKAHFQKGGQEKTRIVCVYGPGINYITVLREKGNVEHGGALYVKPDNKSFRQCRDGRDGNPIQQSEYNIPYYYNSCPEFICKCRGVLAKSWLMGGMYVNLGESSWPWLCANHAQRQDYHPGPIPSVMDYINEATSGLSNLLYALAVGTIVIFC